MGDGPSGELLALVKRLGLATPEKVQSVLRRATRLARGLPLFDSVWIDALAQARILTPFQAEQINAGKGASLLVEDFVLYAPLRSPAYAQLFEARGRATRAGGPRPPPSPSSCRGDR